VSASRPRLIFDAHLDLSWNALGFNRDQTRTVEQLRQSEARLADQFRRGHNTVSLPELRKAGIAVCQGTVLARAKDLATVKPEMLDRAANIDFASQDIAYAMAQGQLAYYKALEKKGEIRMIRTASQLKAHWKTWEDAESFDGLPIGLILAMEGADPIIDPSWAQSWWDQGLRSVGISHYGQGQYGFGTGGNGPLTPRGPALLKELDRLGIILDLTHSSDQTFFEALDIFTGRVLASHNNCRALVPSDRQYSDEQIKRLIQRKAVIGTVFDAWMLQPGYVVGKTAGNVAPPLANAVDHIDHICQLAGNTDHVAFGTDLDGGFGTEQCPDGLETIADLQKFNVLLKERGYAEADIDKIFHGNWLRLFSEALPV
jgi:membrane dipeptidase